MKAGPVFLFPVTSEHRQACSGNKSLNPRFGDHGDIGACDRTSLSKMTMPADGGDPAPPRPRSRRPSPSAKKEASNELGQQRQPVSSGSIASSQNSALGAAGAGDEKLLPGPESVDSVASFQTVIISWPACPASPSCPEDASFTSAFCQEVGHTNAISDSSSKGDAAAVGDGGVGGAAADASRPLNPLLSDGAPLSPPTTSPLITRPDAVVNHPTKTVNSQQNKTTTTCDIPTPPNQEGPSPLHRHYQLSSSDSFKYHRPSGDSLSLASTTISSTYQPFGAPAHGGTATPVDVAKKSTCLSAEKEEMKKKDDDNKAFVRSITGWRLPPGGGLRGGGGETTAIANNGTTGWGPPPPPPSAASNPGSATGGWGAPPPPANQGAVSAWGSPPQAPNNNNNIGNGNSNNNNNAASGGGGVGSTTAPSTSVASAAATSSEDKQLLNNGIKSSPGITTPAAASQPTGTTSWAAAAGKGLPPSEPTAANQMNGATNKQLEQLNSVREALFSQDGWGGQHVKQDTSWDVGGALSEPATPAPPSKAESMQWQAPTTTRNDGTDLWKSTLSGVPQIPKQQPSTPWGNHTPAHPADYKTWGEPDEDPGAGGDSRMPPPPPSGPSWGGLDDQQAPAWESDRGTVKPKEDGWNANPVGGNGGQWNRPGQESGAGWGAPPPIKPSGGGWNGQPGRDQPWHHSESPTIGRRFDDGGWKDMPMPSMGSRNVGPPGPPSRLPPGALKPNDPAASPWGQSHAGSGRSWGDLEPMGATGSSSSSSPWMDDRPTNSGGWGGGVGAADVVGGGWPRKNPMRSSPSWEEPGGGMVGGGPDRGWGGGRGTSSAGGGMLPPMAVNKETIWSSKQFRILCDMGFRKEDVEVALRNTNLQLDDALEMLNAVTRAAGMAGGGRGGGGMGGGSMQAPGNDLVGFSVGPRGGGGGGMDPGYDVRFAAGSGMPYPPGVADCLPPGSNPSLNNPSRGPGGSSGLNPALVQQMSMGGGSAGGGPMHPGGGGPAGVPPRPTQSGGGGGGPPSTSQLRLLVQQIQMAVQAGHLNAQILNQPLAPQTLLLLNQLLQQIKALAQCNQQQAMAVQAAAGGRGSAASSQALLHFNVQITKHKQQITNLQNQITAQQAQYLKNQQHQPPMLPGGGGMVPDNGPDLSLSLGNLALTGVDHHHHHQQQQGGGVGGSKLTKWIKSDSASSQQGGGSDQPDFSRAPGTSAKGSSSSSQQPSPNMLLDPSGPWSNGNNGASAGGWPDTAADKNGGGNSAADPEPDFGIPEFVPGKAWKGATIKDPSEDPTLTPGSVATTPILLQQGGGGDKAGSVVSSSIATTMMENSLGLASSTWSFGTTVKESNMQVKDGWGMPPVGRETNLTPMGQDLWGLSRPLNKQPGSGGGPMGVTDSGWPAATTNGWSNGINNGPQQQQPSGSSWLLLRNLTAQIDGSTLRTLCMQHGPLLNFRLYLTHGIALAKYSNGSEAKKAQSALNNCVLGNTTILAEVAGEPEVESIVRTLSQAGGGAAAGSGPGRSGPPQPPAYSAYAKPGGGDTWGGLGGGGNPWPSTGLGGSVWGAPDDQHNRTTPLNSFLPPDLLSETM